MALAILEPQALEASRIRLKIDTGTNRYFRLRFGKNVTHKYDLDWVDEVFFSTPVRTNEHGGSLLDSSMEVALPLAELKNEGFYTYAQLFSFKTSDGRGPAFSRVLKLPSNLGGARFGRASLLSQSTTMNTTATTFLPPRCPIPCETSADRYAQATSLDDLLSGILKVAGPLVANLLGGNQKDGKANGQPAAADGKGGIGDILAVLLKALLGGAAGSNGLSVSHSQSWNGNGHGQGNRFMQTQDPEFSRPFVFGIDDALFGAIIGQVVQILPQLANAAVQQRIQLKQADNKLTSDVLSEANRRMLLEQLIDARRQPPSGNQPVDPAAMDQLIQLLQQAPAPSAPPAKAAAAAPVAAKSFALDTAPPAQMSRAVISFSAANPLTWNGKPKLVFTKSSGIQFKVRLVISDPVPKNPLNKAIFKFVFKHHREDSIRFEKTFKQKDIVPNSDLTFAFSAADLAALPVNRNLSVLVEMRWPGSNGSGEHKAMGSSEIVLVNKYFLKEQGKAVSSEKELTDMKQYRPFWNKVWEAPSLDAASNPDGDKKKYLWELNVNAKYGVLLSTEHPANGLMETRILRGPTDDQGLSAKTEGRMKAGIELSMDELNKLMPLWEGQAPLDADKLEALRTKAVARNAAGEFVYPLKLKGQASVRGMVWVIPVFKLFEFTLNAVQKTDETGQVVSSSDETVRFPLPVAARVLGLKSEK
jgi:hypothetical protein